MMEWKHKFSEEYNDGDIKIDTYVDNLGYVKIEKQVLGSEYTIILHEHDIVRFLKALHDEEKFNFILGIINREIADIGLRVVKEDEKDGDAETED